MLFRSNVNVKIETKEKRPQMKTFRFLLHKHKAISNIDPMIRQHVQFIKISNIDSLEVARSRLCRAVTRFLSAGLTSMLWAKNCD